MKTVYVKFEDENYNYFTNINGSNETIKEYFIGTGFQFGDTEEKPFDNIQFCINCEIVEGEK